MLPYRGEGQLWSGSQALGRDQGCISSQALSLIFLGEGRQKTTILLMHRGFSSILVFLSSPGLFLFAIAQYRNKAVMTNNLFFHP